MTEKPVGDDYSNDGNVPAERIEQIFSETEQFIGNEIPDCVRDTVERAVLAYYENKDIRQIDYAIDKAQAQYNLKIARKLDNIFLIGLFGIQIDMTNIRTMLRLKFTESEERKVFLEGGFVETEQFVRGLDIGYETLGSLFFATPYFRIVEAGSNYLASDKSFLKVEQQCEEYLTGFLKSTAQITAGPQPVIAYLLMKENEIRTIRLILTAKKNFLDTKLVLDRVT
jgi:V/A-type H+-transporting ATPase subunit C